MELSLTDYNGILNLLIEGKVLEIEFMSKAEFTRFKMNLGATKYREQKKLVALDPCLELGNLSFQADKEIQPEENFKVKIAMLDVGRKAGRMASIKIIEVETGKEVVSGKEP